VADPSTQLSSEIESLTQNMAQLKAEREELMSQMQKIASDKDNADKEKEGECHIIYLSKWFLNAVCSYSSFSSIQAPSC
jgi:prefoldin subunit 5